MKTKLLLLAGFLASLVAQAANFEIKDELEFRKLVSTNAELRKVASKLNFTEGPVWVQDRGGYLVFSDIPADELKQWSPGQGLSTYRKPSHNANGNTVDRRGRLITCEHSGRQVVIEEQPGQKTRSLVQRYRGKKLNSPNDVIVKSDQTIWFTDPPYGVKDSEKEQPGNYVYRFSPRDNSIKAVATDFDYPNGLCFSPDESKLYISDSGAPRHIRVFEVRSGGVLANSKVFCTIDNGLPDGIRCDADGRIWSSSGDGVQIFNPNGKLVGKILVPEPPSNLCFGGKDFNTLFITARTSVYAIDVLVKPAPLIRTADPRRWTKDIEAFEAADLTNAPPNGGIVFVGSSSVRMWRSLAQDFPGYKVINRGFGGSQISDSVYYADRIVTKYKPRMIVMYAGSNDIALGLSPEQVLADFKAFVAKVRQTLPDTKIAFISIAPSPSRWAQVERVKEANRLIAEYINGQKNMMYIDVFHSMLGPDGKPKPDIYIKDNLHMNPKGYAIWTGIVKPYLESAK